MGRKPKAVDLSDYVAAMKKTKGSFTQNWDIAITIDHRKINDLLAERFRNVDHYQRLVREVEVYVDVDDRLGDKYAQWYHLTLGSPRVQFESTSDVPSCSFRVEVTEGRVWAVTADGKIEQEEELGPNVYTISICNIGLGAITGPAQEWDLNDANALKAAGGNDLVVFPDEVGWSSCIVFDLAGSSQLSVNVEYSSDIGPSCAWKSDLLSTALRDFFVREINPLHYALVVVNNTSPPDGITDLVPKAFRFTTLRTSNTESYLSLFIETRSSDRKNDNQRLQSLWITEWTKAGVAPIPKGSSASIIINDAFFAAYFISPALARYNATTTMEATSDKEGGIRLRGTWPKVMRPEVPWETHVRLIALEETKRFRVHSMVYDPNVGGSPLSMTLAQFDGDDKLAAMAIEWSYSFNNPWNGTISRTERDPPVVGVPVRNALELNGTFTSTYRLSLKRGLILLDDGSALRVDVKKSDWTVEAAKTKSRGVRGILLPVPGEVVDQKKLVEFAKDAALDTFEIRIDLVKLKFFAQTNVLSMGQGIELQSSVRVPRDIVVVGGIVTV